MDMLTLGTNMFTNSHKKVMENAQKIAQSSEANNTENIEQSCVKLKENELESKVASKIIQASKDTSEYLIDIMA